MLATRLRMSEPVVTGVGYVFERWDGGGAPSGRGGEDLPLAVRVMTLCNEVEIHARLGGPDAASGMVRQRSGGAFDPAVADLFLGHRDELLGVIDRPALWSDVLAAEPAPHRQLDEASVEDAARVIGDFTDLKSGYLAGHSRAVAAVASAAADRVRLDDAERSVLRLAALMQDVGRVGVTTAIWDKPGGLDDTEWERVRLHPYYSERLLTRASALEAAGRIAGMHHEHPDGSGYHRGSRRTALPVPARLLAAADAYVAMRSARSHRPALPADDAGARLREMGSADQLDAASVNAVLAAAGDAGPPVRRPWPAGLTDREVDVLRRIAQGGSIQDAARDLYVAPKTVDFHLQNIYAKAGVSTRAAATLFAVQNDLLEA
jgi:HD-GYP domain-containing protein (c-di-GMP phosphodiesterase class II)